MIKGGGGALLREKILISAKKVVIVADAAQVFTVIQPVGADRSAPNGTLSRLKKPERGDNRCFAHLTRATLL